MRLQPNLWASKRNDAPREAVASFNYSGEGLVVTPLGLEPRTCGLKVSISDLSAYLYTDLSRKYPPFFHIPRQTHLPRLLSDSPHCGHFCGHALVKKRGTRNVSGSSNEFRVFCRSYAILRVTNDCVAAVVHRRYGYDTQEANGIER